MASTITKPLLAAGALLVLAGGLHHAVHRSRAGAAAYRPLPLSLDAIPKVLGGYTFRKDLQLSPEVLQEAKVDAFLHRQYSIATSSIPLVLYVGYWGRQNVGMGHGPDVCFPAVGWKIERPPRRERVEFVDLEGVGQEATIEIHRFQRVEADGLRQTAVGFVAVAGGEFHPSSRGTFFHGPASSPREGFLAHVEVLTAVRGGAWGEADAKILDFFERVLPHASVCLFGTGGDDKVLTQGGD